MAEFTEVIRQRTRMCNTVKGYCDNCPLSSDKNGIGALCDVLVLNTPTVAENIIMSWAAENPEPQYPTWQEWAESMFGKGAYTCPRSIKVISSDECCSMTCTQCYGKPIPAEIAAKLGIKPKGE